MQRLALVVAISVALLGPAWFPCRAEAAAPTTAKPAADEKRLTLERLFPEKSFFGPSASSAEISRDGRYGAFLYRPWVERRHGPDLWIHDFETGTTTRITMVSVMAQFQEDARKVRDDRLKKATDAQKRERARRDRESGAARRGDAEAAGSGAAKPPAARAVDPIAGVWEGRLSGDGVALVPPEGVAVTVEIARSDSGAVSGIVRSQMGSVAISEGSFDESTGRFSCTLRIEQPPTTARVEVVVEGEKGSGTITVDNLEGTLAIQLERTARNGEATDDDDDARAGGAAEAGADGDAAKAEGAETEVAQAGPVEGERGTVEILDGVVRFTARDLGDWVDEKDADAERAPRYGGISGYVWSPVASELIFTAAGDLYRFVVESGSIERLTRTREDERSVEYLPDGSGYTYMRGEDLLLVAFAGGPIEQLNPRLPSGERMTGYRLSPDGRRLVFIAVKGESAREGRRVNIVNYRDRFAQVQQVPRTTSDDPLPEVEEGVYLYDLEGHRAERGVLQKVYTRKRSGPRDMLRLPEWAPDSSRVAFAVFEQSSGRVDIMEAVFGPPPPEKPEPAADDQTPPASDPGEGTDAQGGDGTGTETESVQKEQDDAGEAEQRGAETTVASRPASLADLPEPPKDPKPGFEIREARAVYRFLHNGGPTTPGLIRPQYLADGRRLVFLTELSGFRQFHLLDPTYEQLEQLTRGRFELYPLELSKDRQRLFAVGTREDPAQQHVYRIDPESGALERISTIDGFHEGAAVSEDGQRVLANHVDFGSLRELLAIDHGSGRTTRLTDSHPDEARELTKAVPEYFTYRNRHGQEIHGHLFRPDDWSPEDRRPLLIYVYGGPLGQRKMAARGAHDAASYFFGWYMAKVHGYVAATIDPRGASGYGGLFEKSNYEQVGKPQVEDLVDGVKWFGETQGVDPKRVGLHGWSFGGFQTQMCMYTEPDVFAVGIAGAGPTEWENYNAWYSTGTIGPSRPGQTDLSKFSLLPMAKNLKGRLLLVHGVEDSNVLYQDTVRVYRELLKAGKEALVDLFIDPTGGHGLGGDVKTLNRYRKYEDFLLTHLGKGQAAAKDAPGEAPPPSEAPPAEPAEAAVATVGAATAPPVREDDPQER